MACFFGAATFAAVLEAALFVVAVLFCGAVGAADTEAVEKKPTARPAMRADFVLNKAIVLLETRSVTEQ